MTTIDATPTGLASFELHPSPPLQLTVALDSDAVRFARMVSAMVNNTSVALYEAAVDATTVYPVGGAATGATQLSLRFRPRDPSRRIDGLVLEEVAAIVGSMAPVTDVRVGA